MAEIDYGAVFGDVMNQGDKAQEAAEPATEPKATGAEVQEAAEPAGESIEDTSDKTDASPEKDVPPAEAESDDKGKGQSKEENAKFASMRRKYEAERDEAIAKAKADAKAEAERALDESIKAMRMTNPYTRKPIESKAEYDEYFQRRQEENARKSREKLGMNEKEYERFVSDLPEVQEARNLKAQAEAEKKAAEEKAFQLRLNEEIKNISMLDPSIKSIEDLSKMDNYKELYEKVARGYSIEDAFRLVNYDRLVKQAGDKSKQAALNGINGKGHLQPTQSRGQGAIPVPADVKEIYRQLVPDATDAEISEHYNRTHRR